ncbi:MAG: 5'-nucleotidase C-terminal domain-containing protein [Clostridia bacterium]|nr:5'-nucleotidase C-terminal domain-containing protein [Clostridia bacterium]
MKRYLALCLFLLLFLTACTGSLTTTDADPLLSTPSSPVISTPVTEGEATETTPVLTLSTSIPVTVPSTPSLTVPVTPSATTPVTPSVTVPATSSPDIPDTPIDPDCHKDTDDNGTCDLCGTTVIVIVDFYNINDIHGKFKDSETQIGVDELSTYLKQQNERDDHTVFLSTGDTWQGSSESNLTEGLIFTDWMNAMGFVGMTLGNHEYDWGSASIKKNAAAAEFPLLAINVFDRATDERVSYAAPSVTVKRGGATIGIIGAIGDCYSSIASDKSADVYFKTGSSLTALVKAESDRLRAAGADLIVYAIHDGYGSSKSSVTSLASREFASYYDTSLSNGYVDLVFEGHSHQRYVLRDEYGVYHLQGGGDNRAITHAEVSVNIANGKRAVTEAEYVYTSVYESLSDDPIVAELLKKYESLIAKGDEILGLNRSFKSSKTLCQLVADLYYEFGEEVWGDDYTLALAGAFLQARSPYEIPAGNVTYSQLQMIFPFDNQIVLCSIKGKDLRRVFYESPHSSYYMHYSDYGDSLWSNINDNATYYVITDTYSSTYARNNMTEIERYPEGFYARDLLAEYIRQGGMAS